MSTTFRFAIAGFFAVTAAACTSLPSAPRIGESVEDGGGTRVEVGAWFDTGTSGTDSAGGPKLDAPLGSGGPAEAGTAFETAGAPGTGGKGGGVDAETIVDTSSGDVTGTDSSLGKGGAPGTGGTFGAGGGIGMGGAMSTGGVVAMDGAVSTGGTVSTGGSGGTVATGGAGGFPDAGTHDALIDAACIPESDAQFCTSVGKSCEPTSGTDNCGVVRTANCGTCPTGKGCVDQVCQTPVCTTFNYASAVYTAGSRTGMEDIAIAASNGPTLVYGQSPSTCGSFNTIVADETEPGSGSYTPRDVSSWVATNKVVTSEMAITGDGLTLVVLSADRKSFASTKRSALQLIDFGAPSTTDFTTVNGFLAGTSGQFRQPAISPDGREFYYTINGISTAADGIYRSVRGSSAGPFQLGTRVSALTSDYEYVTGVSSDRLTLFVFKGFAGFIFTRTSTSAEFVNPNAPNTPPQLGGWQHKPFQSCATMFSMTSPGGCANEDLYFNYRQ